MSVTRRVGRNLALLIVGRFSVLLVWLAMTPAILHRLGAEQFGFWSLLLVILGTIGTVDLGLGIAISRYVSESAARRDLPAVGPLVARAIGLQLLFVLIVAGAGYLLRSSLLDLFRVPDAWRPEAARALAWALFGFIAIVPFNAFGAALQGLQRMDLYAAGMAPGALALLAATLVALQSSTPLVAVVQAQVFQFAVSSLLLGLGLGLAIARWDPGLGGPVSPAGPIAFGRLLRFGGWVQTNAAVALTNLHVDKILLGALVALPSVAAYELGMRVSGVAMLVPQLGLSALLPVMVHREALAEPGARLRTYRAALAPYLALVGLITCGLVSLAGPLLEAWLGHSEPAEVFALRGLALAGGITTATGVVSTMVRAAERPEIETEAGVVGLLLHVGLSWVGWAVWGWQGVIAGLVASAVCAATYFVIRVESWLEASRVGAETLRALVAPAIAALAAGAGGWAISNWTRTGPPGRLRGLVALGWGAATLLVAYAIVVLLLAPAVRERMRSLVTHR
ncbi:MAG: oligosaccharide flippase family protein [Candidatus Eisenbacteria bacterium]